MFLSSERSPEAQLVAQWAAGLALREQGRLDDARRALEDAVAHGEDAGLDERTAQIRDSLVFTLALAGDNNGALEQASLAAPHLEGAARARLDMQVGLVHQRLGDADAALAAFAAALPQLQDAGDDAAEVRLRVNRSVLHVYQSNIAAAVDDLEEAHRLAAILGNRLQLAAVAHNLGFARGRSGDIPNALAAFAEAADAYAAAGVEAGLAAVLETDRAETLLNAGLSEEAFSAATRSVDLLAASGNEADLAEARLLAGRAALADGRVDTAAELAARAEAALRDQGREGWVALASYVALQAQFAPLERSEMPTPADLRRVWAAAEATAGTLRAAGWEDEAHHASILAARCAIKLGDSTAARALLESSAAARQRGPISSRARAWHATALLRVADGDWAGARRAVTAGVRLLDDNRAILGATELRASAASHGQELSRLGTALALRSQDTKALLRWADRVRAGAMALQPVNPPDDPQLARDLSELRSLDRKAREAVLAGDSSSSIRRQQAQLQTAVRRRARTRRGERRALGRLDPVALRRALADRTLIEYIEHAGRLYAVTVGPAGYRRHTLGASERLRDLADFARFDLHRLAHATGGDRALDAARVSVEDTGNRIADAVLAPLGLDPDRPLVIVPTGLLHGLPWRTLPPLLNAAFVVAPSAESWLTRATASRSGNGIVFVAGPDLPAARQEVRQLARRYRTSRSLTGRNATARNVLDALSRNATAHVAAHGDFRPDNPMFSSLRMADGRMTVYELEHLARVPDTMVLPACDAAVSGVKAGDELLGLSAVLLGMGVRTLVAPQVPIPDAAAKGLMIAFHRELARGVDAATALSRATGSLPDDEPAVFAVKRSFVVLGA